MKAITVHRKTNGRPALRWEHAEPPVCGPEDVLVRVHATAVNRADLLQARGLYPAPPGHSPILGLEAAGEVTFVGSDVSGWVPGDRVCALVAGGGYAEQVRIHHRMLLPLPAGWSFETGTAVPEVWLTAFSNLFMEGGLVDGETVLIHAGASGVGTAAIQLATAAGARVIATAGTDKKCLSCRNLGASSAINYREADFRDIVRSTLDGAPLNLVLDCVGGPYLENHLNLLGEGGRLVIIGLMGGSEAAIDLAAVLGKSLRIIGTRLRARPLEVKTEIVRRFRDRFWPSLMDGSLKTVIDCAFPITEANAAHAYVNANRNTGKVILTMPG